LICYIGAVDPAWPSPAPIHQVDPALVAELVDALP
jgi:hypothetical protein